MKTLAVILFMIPAVAFGQFNPILECPQGEKINKKTSMMNIGYGKPMGAGVINFVVCGNTPYFVVTWSEMNTENFTITPEMPLVITMDDGEKIELYVPVAMNSTAKVIQNYIAATFEIEDLSPLIEKQVHRIEFPAGDRTSAFAITKMHRSNIQKGATQVNEYLRGN